jgi:Tol biopolymer transport system component
LASIVLGCAGDSTRSSASDDGASSGSSGEPTTSGGASGIGGGTGTGAAPAGATNMGGSSQDGGSASGGDAASGANTGGTDDDAGAGSGGEAASGGTGVDCDEGGGDDAPDAPVGPPPAGYLVYIAEVPGLGEHVFHVRVDGDGIHAPLKLTPDFADDDLGYLVIPHRPATIYVTGNAQDGRHLYLVDFDANAASEPVLLNPPDPSGRDTNAIDSYGLSPDGRLLHFIRRGGVHITNLEEATPTDAESVGEYDRAGIVGWSGRRLLFFAGESGDLMLADATSFPPSLARLVSTDPDSGSGSVSAMLSPDGSRSLYRRTFDTGESRWYWLDLTEGEPRPVQLSGALLGTPSIPWTKAWSPDSRYFVGDFAGLVLIDFEGSDARVISAGGAEDFTYASFSPDSRRLVYVARHYQSASYQIFGVDLSSGAPSSAFPLIRGTEEEQAIYGAQGMGPEWLSDSRYVHYYNPNAIYLADAWGCSGERKLFADAEGASIDLYLVRPASDRRRIAFFSEHWTPGDRNVYVADLDAEGDMDDPVLVSEPGGTTGFHELRFVDNDWLIYYEQDDENRRAMHIAPRDGSVPARSISGLDHDMRHTHWLPDPP